MEYLFARQFARGKIDVQPDQWTDQIITFLLEMLRSKKFSGETLRGLTIRNPGDGLEYALVPAGRFQRGAVPGDGLAQDNEKPRRQIEITKHFWMSTTPVTVAAYKRFAQAMGRGMPEAPGFNSNWSKQDHPIVRASWDDARAYCEWAAGRLPTEAEWEYAARGGEEGLVYPWGDELSAENANYASTDRTAPVKSYPANGFGLYDVSGNVYEWCADWYGADYYKSSPSHDPPGAATGANRVIRGGSWVYSNPRYLRCSYRVTADPDDRSYLRGFRCVREGSP